MYVAQRLQRRQSVPSAKTTNYGLAIGHSGYEANGKLKNRKKKDSCEVYRELKRQTVAVRGGDSGN